MSETDHSLDSQTDTDAVATQSLTLVQAVRHGLDTALTHDDDVVVLGQDIGKKGGVLGATEGLWETHGDDRVIDTPLAESGIVGTAVGMAAMGMRPVPEIQFSGYSYPGYDQIVSHMSRFRTRSRGEFTLPMTLRAPYGGGTSGTRTPL
jgi:Pyruvate/2-oxoglutarate dehydrogenase complex, dehydrogenase (E1) component, eukaryotic type, beta subunit